MKFQAFESRAIESADVDKAYEKAQNFLRRDRFESKQFEKFYEKEAIERDEKYVEDMKVKFEKDMTPEKRYFLKLSTILEAIVDEHAELSEWLGSNVTTYKTSEYDDIRNGVDTIVEMENDDIPRSDFFGLVMDETFNQDIGRKLDRIRKEIEEGKLAEVKYFFSDSFKGTLLNIPRVIVAVEQKTAKELAELWLTNDKKALAEHPIQYQILEEILLQLETFKLYAEKGGMTKEAAIFQKTHAVLDEIYKAKIAKARKNAATLNMHDRDAAFYILQENLASFRF